MAYVVNQGNGTLTPINLATRTAGPAIALNTGPITGPHLHPFSSVVTQTETAIAITSDGSHAYVVDAGQGTVIPVNLAAGTADKPIHVGPAPLAIAVWPR